MGLLCTDRSVLDSMFKVQRLLDADFHSFIFHGLDGLFHPLGETWNSIRLTRYTVVKAS